MVCLRMLKRPSPLRFAEVGAGFRPDECACFCAGGSLSEIRESLWTTPRSSRFPETRAGDPARSALRGVGRSLIQDGSLRKSNVRFRLPHKTGIQPPDESRDG